MKKARRFMMALTATLMLVSCAELEQIARETIGGDEPTRSEIISGLKEALVVGTDKAVQTLGVTNGYFGNELVKIYLPPEADVIIDNLNKIPGGQDLVNDVLLRINRAAEDAATEAKPIFVNSIRQMTIPDAVGILKGDDNAATQYLHRTTYNELFRLYRPKIENSLSKDLVGNVSTAESWNTLTSQWNKLAGSVVGQVAGFEKVEVDLANYLTGKALDGLFLKIEQQEELIREDPAARVTELLRKVFGSVD